ncbi:MAG: ribonuclease HI family protein [Candidatus Brocadiales bacterium]|nr:ribonuclease HI family protein [Candidatus Brocadiales bacterium]
MEITIHTDGSSDLIKGTSGRGWAMYDEEGKLLEEGFDHSTEGLTNNQEEYKAVIAALEHLATMFPDATDEDKVFIKTDSELVVKQLTGVYKIRKPHLKPLAKRIKELINASPMTIGIQHVYREYNSDADSLARKGLNAANLE